MGDFAMQIKQFNAKTEKQGSALVRKICLDLSRRIIKKTPVDTGRARANWQASITTPASVIIELNDKSGAQSIAKAGAVASNAWGNVFYLTNNLPYAAVLEYGLYGTGASATEKTNGTGYSVQAPNGMVRVSIAEMRGLFY